MGSAGGRDGTASAARVTCACPSCGHSGDFVVGENMCPKCGCLFRAERPKAARRARVPAAYRVRSVSRGAWVRALDDAGMTQADLARRLGFAPPTLSNYVSGARRMPADVLMRAAAILGVSAEELWG